MARPTLPQGSSVLVPLCGKTPDIVWLAAAGHAVTGVELARTAVEAFFAEQELAYTEDVCGGLARFRATDRAITFYCGDYFSFDGSFGVEPFDVLYDRGALVALPRDMRPRYVAHTNRLLRPDAPRLVITLEYDQSIVAGPPFAVMPDEILGYWSDLERVGEKDDIDTCPPKFRAAGLEEITEVYWLSSVTAGSPR